MMRFAAPACLAALFLVLPSYSSAELRYYSSRLLDAGGNESLTAFAAGIDGGMFLEITLDSLGTLGEATGPGRVLAKLDAAGSLVWGRTFPLPAEIAASPDGGVVLYGNFVGTVNFGSDPMTAQDMDVFLVKFAADGQLQWQRRFGGDQGQRGTALVVDDEGNIILTGSNALTIDFGGGAIHSNGADDAFLAKLDANGGHLWSRGFGLGGAQLGISLDVGADRRIAWVILFNGLSVDFGAGRIYNVGGSDVAAAVFDETGALAYSIHAGSPLHESAFDVTFDAQGNIFICGSMIGALDLGGGVLTPLADNATNGFAASYDRTGAHRWSWVIPDPVGSGAIEAGADNLGNCFIVGGNRGQFKFGLDDVTPSESLVLAFQPDGEPLDAIGFSLPTLRLHMNLPRDRILFGTSVNSEIDFGGGPLVPDDSDVALAVMGVRGPPQATITHFGARVVDAGVELTWRIVAGEALAVYSLSRRVDGSSSAQILHTGDAAEGDFSYVDATSKPGRLYSYRLTVITAFGDELYSDWTSVTIPAAVTTLDQNAPNPFNPVTTFVYSLAEPARVSIVIYDQSGALVGRLDQGMQPAGTHRASWGGHNARGEFVASGVYFYRLEGVPGVGARKMMLLK